MKAFTSVEQSKKLAEFLPLESADMTLPFRHTKDDKYLPGYVGARSYIDVYNDMIVLPGMDKEEVCKLIQPCWSLAALLALIPTDDKKDEYYVDTESHSDYHTVSYKNCWDGCIHSEYSEESLLDAAFEMVCWLKENKKI